MIKTRILCLLAAVCCLLGLAVPAGAAVVECDGIYCFGTGDFQTGEEALVGICITSLPDSAAGTVMLGSRELRPGDVLTAGQVDQMTFLPLWTEEETCVEVEYLPIYPQYVDGITAMTISIRGKEDKAPVAEDFAVETYKNLPNSAKLKVSDPEGQALSYTITREPKRGEVTIAQDGTFTYTPKKNKVGVDSFVYTAMDPAGNVSREATVTITILKPTDAKQYTDTPGHACRFAAEWMKHTGIFVGESLSGNPCFQPDQEVTRGEFVTMLVKALDIPVEAENTYTGYTDAVADWLKPYLAAAVRSGLTAGLPQQDVFGAAEVITGAEAAVMLQNALDLSLPQMTDGDAEALAPVWAQTAVRAVKSEGIELDAQLPLTRGVAAQMLYRAAQLAEPQEEILQ